MIKIQMSCMIWLIVMFFLLIFSLSELIAESITFHLETLQQTQEISSFHPNEPPVLLERIDPVYPPSLRELGLEGTVVLEAEILADGTVGEIEVVQSLGEGLNDFDVAAINAVKQWKFKSASFAGHSTVEWIRQEIQFTINNENNIKEDK